MAGEIPIRRMTLRQLLTHTEKQARDLHEQLYTTLLVHLTEFRDLSRPVRRRSNYPTFVALQNALTKLVQAGQRTQTMADHLRECLTEIRDHAKRELVSRG